MMKQSLSIVLKYSIASVWLINGLFCKVLDFVPRHNQIVSEILGFKYAALITISIGVAEALMALWILSGLYSRLNAIVQITIILLMNVIELILVPELLLWGQWNMVFAILFCGLIFYNEFSLKRIVQQS